jgi:hypothetical protein
MFGRRAYTIDSCYVAFAVTGRRPRGALVVAPVLDVVTGEHVCRL